MIRRDKTKSHEYLVVVTGKHGDTKTHHFDTLGLATALRDGYRNQNDEVTLFMSETVTKLWEVDDA